MKKREKKIHNREKDFTYKQEAWNSGKLIEENHNQGPYSPEYTRELTKRLVLLIAQDRKESQTEKEFLSRFLSRKKKIIDLLLLWNPDVSRDIPEHEYLKTLLETYWDKIVPEKSNLNELLNINLPEGYDK